ncbi:hypothetical protein ACM0LK_01210 [Mycoplasma sp. Z331B]|uniref:hypothetical protein n=1 Tax=Mycoplasma sp. Z331B TaxID=3398775 RepID=UPI003A89BFC9
MRRIPKWAKITILITSILIILSGVVFLPLSILVFKSEKAAAAFGTIFVLSTLVAGGLAIYGGVEERRGIERTRQATWNIEKMLRENMANNQNQNTTPTSTDSNSRIQELEKELKTLKADKQVNSYFEWENKR